MVNRERWIKMSEFETVLLAQGLFAGAKFADAQQAATRLSQEYKNRLFHRGFSARRLAARLKGELAELRANQRRLKTLDSMTV